MRRNRELVTLIVSLVLAVSALSTTGPVAHGTLEGTVCIAEQSMTDCPPYTPSFTGTTGSQLTVAVNIQASESFQGIDIRVQTDPNVLNPSTISPEGSLLSQSQFGIYWFGCVNGVPTNSSAPGGCGSFDAPGIARMVATGLGSTGMVAPVTGRLFRVTYDIVNGSGATPINFPSAPSGTVGCDPSSVQGTTICIQVSTSSTILPETFQPAGFNVVVPPPPSFNMFASPNRLTIRLTGRLSSQTASSTIFLTSRGGFTADISLSASVGPVVKKGIVVSLDPTVVTLPPDSEATSTLKVTAFSGTPRGTYTVTVTAVGGGLTRQTTVAVTIVIR